MFKINDKNANSDVLNETLATKTKSPSVSSPAVPDRSIPQSTDSSKQQVRLEGGLQFGDTDNLAYTVKELTDVLNEFVEAEKFNSVRSLIKLYPDLIAQILINANGNSISWTHLVRVAKLFDEQWSRNDSKRWQNHIQNISRNRKATRLIETQTEFLRRIEINKPNAALELHLSQLLWDDAGAITTAEVHRLEGIAYLMIEDDRRCIQSFEKSLRVLENNHPYQASRIGLLLGETHRHAGALESWKSNWEKAIDIQSRWLVERGLVDPAFWKKAAFLRPVSTEWPAVVVHRLASSLKHDNLDFDADRDADRASDNEAVVWAVIGTQSLKRHESQNAILAFKKSEALASNLLLKQELQMQQAIAMIDRGQPGPASAILLRLGSKPNLLGDRAKAILATLKLQNGSLAQGMNLLQSAIKTSNQWPTSERLQAQADYGLAYLMRGREKLGIQLLNQVYDEFVKHDNFQHAIQCLENIAAYYEATDQPSMHKTTVKRIKELDSF